MGTYLILDTTKTGMKGHTIRQGPAPPLKPTSVFPQPKRFRHQGERAKTLQVPHPARNPEDDHAPTRSRVKDGHPSPVLQGGPGGPPTTHSSSCSSSDGIPPLPLAAARAGRATVRRVSIYVLRFICCRLSTKQHLERTRVEPI